MLRGSLSHLRQLELDDDHMSVLPESSQCECQWFKFRISSDFTKVSMDLRTVTGNSCEEDLDNRDGLAGFNLLRRFQRRGCGMDTSIH